MAGAGSGGPGAALGGACFALACGAFHTRHHFLETRFFIGQIRQGLAATCSAGTPGCRARLCSSSVCLIATGTGRLALGKLADVGAADTGPMDKIMAGVEAHLRHELELSDYATASIRNSGQIPEHLQTRQKKEDAAYGRIWQGLFADAIADGEIRAGMDPRMARLLVMGALNWAAEWWDPRRDSVEAIVSNAQILVRSGLTPEVKPKPRKR